MRYDIKNGEIVESFFIDASYDTRDDALEALRWMQLDTFIKENHAEILNDLTHIVKKSKQYLSVESSTCFKTEPNEPWIDVRLCVDLTERYGITTPTWIIRTGSADYDQVHSEYCAASHVHLAHALHLLFKRQIL